MEFFCREGWAVSGFLICSVDKSCDDFWQCVWSDVRVRPLLPIASGSFGGARIRSLSGDILLRQIVKRLRRLGNWREGHFYKVCS
jgi:hypothetical protein